MKERMKNPSLFVKKISILIVLLTFSFMGMTQSTIMVSGQVKDGVSKENLSFCTVSVLNKYDSLITGGITNDKGYFEFPLLMGSYQVIVSYVGFENDTTDTGDLREDTFLGILKLNSSNVNLEEFTIKESTHLTSIDKEVQIITDVQRVGANDTKDVLNNITGVSADKYSGEIKVDNDNNILILVNGVEKNQEYIKNLDPDRLQKVEVIRDPGGRYGLEGYAAVINVVLRTDYKGVEFFVSEQPIIDLDTKSMDDLLLINEFYASYNYTYNKLNIYGTVDNEFNHFPLTLDSKTTYDSGLEVIERSSGIGANSLMEKFTNNYTLGMDYTINPKHTVSFENSIQSFPATTDNTDVLFNSTEVLMDGSLVDTYAFSSSNRSSIKNRYHSLFYVGKLNNNNDLEVNFTYSDYIEKYTSGSQQSNSFNRLQEGENSKIYSRFNTEWTHRFKSGFTIQSGYGNTFKKLENTFLVSHIDLTNSQSTEVKSSFNLTDTRHKLYSYLSWRINEQFSTKIGIAGEYSAPIAEGQRLEYLIAQPLFDFRYKVNKNFVMKLKYRARSNYPSIDQANPFVNQLNAWSISKGNPFLKPEITHRLSVRAHILQGLFGLEPYYHFSNNRIANIGSVNSNDIVEYTFNNVGSYENKGVRMNFIIPLKRNLIIKNNLNFYNSKISFGGQTYQFSDWRAKSEFLYIFQKSEAVTGLIYQREMSRQINGLGYTRPDVDFWLFIIQRPLFKKRGSIMVGYFLPTNFGVMYNQGSYTQAPGVESYQNVDVTTVKNMFIMEFSYRFNKGKKVRKTEKNIEKDIESKGGGLF